MLELKNKLLIILSLAMLLAGWIGWWGMNFYAPEKIIPAYPVLPFVFFLTGFAFIYFMVNSKKTNPLKIASLYLMLKVAKMFVFGITALIYVLGTDVDKKVFVVVFSGMYVVYTASETFAYYRMEKTLKNRE